MLAKIRTLYLGYAVVFEKLAERSLNLMGWEIDNHCPLELDQYVMIAAPHTSNWDALYARLALKALGVNVRITIKDSYMKLPFRYHLFVRWVVLVLTVVRKHQVKHDQVWFSS